MEGSIHWIWRLLPFPSTCYCHAHSPQWHWELWVKSATSEHWKLAWEYVRCSWPKRHRALGSSPGRCWLLLICSLPPSLKCSIASQAGSRTSSKMSAPHCSLICGDESHASKCYSLEDFTDFYFMLNLYLLLANDKLSRFPCTGISALGWGSGMFFWINCFRFLFASECRSLWHICLAGPSRLENVARVSWNKLLYLMSKGNPARS